MFFLASEDALEEFTPGGELGMVRKSGSCLTGDQALAEDVSLSAIEHLHGYCRAKPYLYDELAF